MPTCLYWMPHADYEWPACYVLALHSTAAALALRARLSLSLPFRLFSLIALPPSPPFLSAH